MSVCMALAAIGIPETGTRRAAAVHAAMEEPPARGFRRLLVLDDAALVARCRNGDAEAFSALVERYKDRVYWLVNRIVGRLDDEDLTQEVFLRAYEALPGFREESRFSTWLYRIARNLCLSELRKRGRRGEHLSLEGEESEGGRPFLSPGREDPGDQVERRDVARAVRELMARLPERYRTALTLFYLHEVRYEEIAEIMGIPLGTVKTHLRRGRLRLRDLVLAEPDLAALRGRPLPQTSDEGGG